MVAYLGLNLLHPVKEQLHGSSNMHWLDVSVSLDSPERHCSPTLLSTPFYNTDMSPSLGGLYVSWGSFPDEEILSGQFKETGDIF